MFATPAGPVAWTLPWGLPDLRAAADPRGACAFAAPSAGPSAAWPDLRPPPYPRGPRAPHAIFPPERMVFVSLAELGTDRSVIGMEPVHSLVVNHFERFGRVASVIKKRDYLLIVFATDVEARAATGGSAVQLIDISSGPFSRPVAAVVRPYCRRSPRY